MKSTIIYKSLFAYSEKSNTYFFTEFDEEINIIYGKNTSGKSSVMQAIHYTFGINDEKYKLTEILTEKVIFRLDFILKKGNTSEKIIVIRDDEFIYINRENSHIKKFNGINGDNSQEHIYLKNYWADLFNFKLHLLYTDEYKQASIEAMFLPYYVPQDVGWTSRHKAFRGLDFIKNFRQDFFDYYLGIVDDYDREGKRDLERQKKELQNEIEFLKEIEKKDDDLKLSTLKDERFKIKANEYLTKYKENKDELIKIEKEFLSKSNERTFLEQKLLILNKIKNQLNKQNPLDSDCPTCKQKIASDLGVMYEYFQDKNDTINQIEKIKLKIKGIQSDINNHYLKRIEELKSLIDKDYSILENYEIENLSVTTWLDNKTNVKLGETIIKKLSKKDYKLNIVDIDLKKYKTEKEIIKERSRKDYEFKEIFKPLLESYLDERAMSVFNSHINFLLLYKIPTFTNQGVELLKIILAYNFAFNKIISKTDYVHRFPFMLDAIFKEDIDDNNRAKILTFIKDNKPIDTQVIISIADSKDNKTTANDYNRNFFDGKAKLILINNQKERSFLKEYDNNFDEFLAETLIYIE